MRGPVPTHGVAGLADIDQAALGDEQQLIEQGEDGGPRLVDGAHHRDVVPQLVTERKSGRCSSYSSFNHSSAETKRSQLGVNLGSTWGEPAPTYRAPALGQVPQGADHVLGLERVQPRGGLVKENGHQVGPSTSCSPRHI